MCEGMAITLTDTLAGGTWVCNNTNASITTTGILTGLNAGLDTIYYNLRTACGIGYASIVVDIKALPDAGTITGPQQVCVNATITLDNLSKNGHWALTNTHAKSDSNLITGLLAGKDTVKYTVTNSCGTDITIFPITINALPNAGTITGLDSICPGDTINSLTDTTSGGFWGHSNTSVATLLDSGKLISLLPGIDTITYSVTNTCGTSLAIHAIKIRTLLDCDGPPNTQFKVGCSGEGDILIYPNPSRSGEFTFNLFSKYQEEVTITIVNTLGQRITKFDGLTNNYTNIALTLPAGLYIVTAYTPHGKCSEKLVVEVDR